MRTFYRLSAFWIVVLLFSTVQLALSQTNQPGKTPPKESPLDAPTRPQAKSPLDPPVPQNVEVTYELTDDGKGYTVYERVGGKDIRPPSFITREEYEKMIERQQNQAYFRNKSRQNSIGAGGGKKSLIPDVKVDNKLFQSIFGSNKIDIRPNVNVLIDFSIRNNQNKNPSLTQRQQNNTAFNFQQQIQMDVQGSVGEKLKLRVNYDTQATFAFENQFKINYEGKEDDIIKRIEAGNVSLPINGTLITGGQNLWGVKIATQFGPVTVTTLASQQRGRTQEISVNGGSTTNRREIKAGEYDDNRHFFLSHFFRSQYENSLRNLPLVTSTFQIRRAQVWVTNRSNATTQNLRNAMGFIDLGENDTSSGGRIFNPRIVQTNPQIRYASNNANNLFERLQQAGNQAIDINTSDAYLRSIGLQNGQDFEFGQSLRLLNEGTDYVLNKQLGYVSLNQKLNQNDVMFVAYEYVFNGDTTPVFVGQFSDQAQSNQQNTNLLLLKMIKPSSIRPGPNPNNPDVPPYPTWDLMMKNVYNVAQGSLSPDGFNFEIVYESTDGNGDLIFFQDGLIAKKPLIQVFGLDRLMNSSEIGTDNKFDFIPGVTVNPDRGFIVFPVLEPFGDYFVRELKKEGKRVNPNNPDIYLSDSSRFAFPQLYRYTQVDAINYFQRYNRFKFRVQYAGRSSSEIYLNSVQVAPGSVKVTSGGTQLTEGSDYNVDYSVGKVTILNPAYLNAGQDLKVSFETNTLFGIDNKSLVGARVDVKAIRNLNLGGTILYLNERPLINKIYVGEEPQSSLMWGIDGSFKKESRFITSLVDKLPFYSTNVPSEITFNGEFAQLIPTLPSGIQTSSEKGIAYIDDFESSKNTIDLMGFSLWKLASLPLNTEANNSFRRYLTPYANDTSNRLNKTFQGFTRSLLSWYMIDPLFYDQPATFGFNNQSPEINDLYARRVTPTEFSPNRTIAPGTNVLATLDLRFEPSVRGPYNYQYDPNKLNLDGTFRNPRENWAGIMRRTGQATDFEALNIEFLEFWMMDPFLNETDSLDNNAGVDLFFNLGRISEDVIPDNRYCFENGLPVNEAYDRSGEGTTPTPWGRFPSNPTQLNAAFAQDANSRRFQDVGLDGLSTEREREHFDSLLQHFDQLRQQGLISQQAYDALRNDPSSDNYAHFRDFSNPTDLPTRYRRFNGMDGNSPINQPGEAFTRSATPNPDSEDFDGDNKQNTIEQYYEYHMRIRPGELKVGRNFIVDRRDLMVKLPRDGDGQKTGKARWFQFRIPLRSGTPISGIQDFKSMNFVRIYMTNGQKPITLRFGRMELVATPWRRFINNQEAPDAPVPPEPPITSSRSFFEIGTINVEDNGFRSDQGAPTSKPVNRNFYYVIPPDIQRQRQPTSVVPNQLMNEQSLVMRVNGMKPGEEQGAFRLLNYDLRNYKKMKMWVHAEKLVNGRCTADPDAYVFVRIGSDLTDNYYEYELKVQRSDTSTADFFRNTDNIWRNNIELPLENFQKTKLERNRVTRNTAQRFESRETPGFSIIGTPRLDQVKSIMVGIRNKQGSGQDLCLEVWVNEIRVTDFDVDPSWAANARVNLKIADLGNVSLTGNIATPRFGSIDKRINERSQDYRYGYDIVANINGGKLFPEKARLELPVYLQVGERWITPRYDPLDPDIRVADALESKKERGIALDNIAEDYTRNIAYSFTNVRIVRKGGGLMPGMGGMGGGQPGGGQQNQRKPRPWDIENFAFTFGFNERYQHNAQVQELRIQKYTGAIGYNFTHQPKNYKPFQGIKSRWLVPISSLNLTPVPRQITMRMEGNYHNEYQRNRYLGNPEDIINKSPFDTVFMNFNKDFTIRRTYNVQWDLTQSLRFTYDANNLSRIDMPYKTQDTTLWGTRFSENALSFGKNPDKLHFNQINLGRTINFNQRANISYQLPIRMIKPLDWVNYSINYSGDYRWESAQVQNLHLGNQIANNRNINHNLQLNMTGLYKKFPIIQKWLKPIPKKSIVSKADSTRKDGDETVVFFKRLGKFFGGILFSIQTIDFSFTQTDQTQLAGFMPRTDNFGLDFNYEDRQTARTPLGTGQVSLAPGWFAFGWQPDLTSGKPGSWLYEKSRIGWFARNAANTRPYGQSHGQNFRFRTMMMPVKDFRVEITAEFSDNRSLSGAFVWDDDLKEFKHNIANESGQFSMSIWSMGSLFNPDGAFKQFDQSRREVSGILARNDADYQGRFKGEARGGVISSAQNSILNGYSNGYLNTSQPVLIRSFLSSYAGYDKNKLKMSESGVAPLSNLPLLGSVPIPLPAWNITYNGLANVEPFKAIFKTITIRHGYKSTYSAGYFRNLNPETLFVRSQGMIQDLPDSSRIVEFQNLFNVQTISVTEQFQPLVGISLGFKNNMTVEFEYRMRRTTTLNMSQLEVNENNNTDITFRFNWRRDKMLPSITIFGRNIDLKNATTYRCDITFRNNSVQNRYLDRSDPPFPTNGAQTFVIRPAVDYQINSQLTLQVYLEHNRNTPLVSTSFPTSFTQFGVQARFNLQP